MVTLLYSELPSAAGAPRPERPFVVRETTQVTLQKPRLLDRVRPALRARHYSRRTDEAYVAWIKRDIFFHGKRHPAGMAAPDVTRFLSALAAEGRVGVSTQNQALSATPPLPSVRERASRVQSVETERRKAKRGLDARIGCGVGQTSVIRGRIRVSRTRMNSTFEDIPHRIFLDSSALQVLQTYGGFFYENEPLLPGDRVHHDPRGVAKLEALRCIMLVAERAPFEFALSENSFAEVDRRGDPGYLQWAYDVLDHWLACLEESKDAEGDSAIVAAIGSASYGYLGAGDRALLRNALALGCDTFLTMENKLPKNAAHIQKTLGIRVLSPIEMWEILQPWAALFR